MTTLHSVETPLYAMPPEMDIAYSRVHTWLDNSPEHKAYRRCSWNSDKAPRLLRHLANMRLSTSTVCFRRTFSRLITLYGLKKPCG